MKTESGIWIPMGEYPPTDQFVCNYKGPFSGRLEINRPRLEKFLSLASMDGRLLLTGSTARPEQSIPEMNPDGTLSAKGRLNWGDILPSAVGLKTDTTLIKPDNSGWVISINGDIMAKKIMNDARETARTIEAKFANSFSSEFQEALVKTSFLDKFTSAKDPWIIASVTDTLLRLSMINAFIQFNEISPIFAAAPVIVSMSLLGNAAFNNIIYRDYRNIQFKKAKLTHPLSIGGQLKEFLGRGGYRRTVKNVYEGLLPSLEVDRFLVANSYLAFQSLKGNPLVRLSPKEQESA